jgi:hypothetical protein
MIGGNVCGELLATFADDDDLVEQLRKRMSYIGVSFGVVEELAGMSEGALGKYLSPPARDAAREAIHRATAEAETWSRGQTPGNCSSSPPSWRINCAILPGASYDPPSPTGC